MSWRLREPIPETIRDEVIRNAHLARARDMREFFANAFMAALRLRRRSRRRNTESHYALEASLTRRP